MFRCRHTSERRRWQGAASGPIWIEDQDYNIVRFNGRYVPSPNNEFSHFDSWRVNAGGLWLPTYIYAQEEGYRWGPVHTAPMRAQTRLWDYQTSKDRAQQAFTELTVDSPGCARRKPGECRMATLPFSPSGCGKTQARRKHRRASQKAGLLAPPGEVDQVLDTVLNNMRSNEQHHPRSAGTRAHPADHAARIGCGQSHDS